jgi:eukaryotic-like serine/threonine-protein kinase
MPEMTLFAGSRLGPYEIATPLGAGGMGEVYKARDTRLGRTVAVKVLPQHLSSSPETRQRFEREAKTISQLSHPHICALYDVGNQDGVEYLVMEYLEGETLAERLVRGQLPLEQTLRHGIEIADALDKAHRQGIVHRDLKPGNVMLTKSGVKLLDFGLAKAVGPGGPASAVTSFPTVAGGANLTQEGTILGTLQYMAPEQLEGKEADARTDIFAFGTVLYEMATGKKAFTGTSQASLIGAILHTEPQPISTVEPMSPPALDRVVKTCLAKDPEDRFQTAHDVKLQLQWIAEGGSVMGLPAPVIAWRKGRERIAWIVAAVATVAALGLAAFLLTRSVAPPRMTQTSILPPEKSAFVFDSGPPVLSPDGARLVFVAPVPDGKNLLWIRPLNGMSAQPLAGTEGGSYPFWSQDSRFVGFFAGGKLKRIDASGGPPQTLCDAPIGRGGTWNREGVIVFAASTRDSLSRVSSAGGTPSQLAPLDASKREYSHRLPFFLPDGRHFLYLAQSVPGAERKDPDIVYVGSLDSKERTAVVRARTNAVYVPPMAGHSDGQLLFVRERTLLAHAFDAKNLRVTGEAVPIGEAITSLTNYGFTVFSASDSGLVAYHAGGAGGVSKLAWLDRSGKEIETVGAPADYLHPRLSHDGRRLAVDSIDPQTGRSDVWVIDLQRQTPTRLTFGPTDNTFPVWSPDDSRIAFSSSRNGTFDLFVKSSSGTGNEEALLVEELSFKVVTDWSLDSRFVAFHSISTTTKSASDIWMLSPADKKLQVFLSTPANEFFASFSPDGHWVTYMSDESGKHEVYVQPFPPSGGKWQISTAGGREPVWSRDGKEIFYVTQDPSNKVVVVDVKTSPSFEAGTPRVLFETRLKAMQGRRWDVSTDGKRFLINTPIGEVKSQPITLVQNWTAELKK